MPCCSKIEVGKQIHMACNTAQGSIRLQELCLLLLWGRKDTVLSRSPQRPIFTLCTLIRCCIFPKIKMGKVWIVPCFLVLELIVIWMVELAHQAVDVGRRVTPNVGNEESNELWRDVVKHWAMNVDLCQDLPFCEWQHFLW